MWFYFVIFISIMLLGSIYKYKLTSNNQWVYLFLWFFLFIVAAFRGENVDNDHLNYIQAIQAGWGVTEPSFYLISYLCYNVLGSIKLVFIIYASLSVTLLFFALKRTADYFYLSLVIYFSTFYVLHDLNQIRAAVGFGFAMFAIKPWINNNIWQTIIYILLATFFHFSFIILFPICILIKNNSKHILLYIYAIPIVYLFYFNEINASSLLMKIPIIYIQNMVINYSEWNIDIVSNINVFSIMVLIKLVLIFIFIFFRHKLSSQFKGFYLFIKLYILGLLLFIFMGNLPGAAFRVAEILWMVECLLLPMLIICFKPHWLIINIILLLCLYWMWLNYIASNFIKPYYFDFNL